ncbi:MAG TPA: potassium/proton antiporter [Ignavibacteria bacterium]|nr:potassium/proton antiporter [Ignavibacteria bacterium]
MFSFDNILFFISLLIVISIFITKISENFGLPALLLFLGIGMLAGSDGIGKIYFDDVNITQSVGTVALILILFSGGLSTNISSVFPVRKEAVSLATIGVILTAVLVGLFCHYVLGFDFIYGLLIGAIVSSTDAAAVFSILRSNNINLKNNLKPLLELESGCNDPMAIFLTMTITTVIVSNEINVFSISVSLIKQFIFGGLIGYYAARGVVKIFNRINLSYEGLYPVLALASAVLIYSLTTLTGGSGYLAVYIAGIIIGNSNIIQKRSLIRFFDGLAWLGQIGMFLTLGLLVYPSQLIFILSTGILLSMFLIFAARPVSVFISLIFSKYKVKEKLAISWIGLRGAVPIILATIPLSSGIDDSHKIFNLVFFIVISSALIQGWTIKYITKIFKVSAKSEQKINSPVQFESLGNNTSELFDIIVPFNSKMKRKTIIDLNLPKDCLVIFVCRDEIFFVPNGNTVLEAGDVLQILMNKKDLPLISDKLK